VSFARRTIAVPSASAANPAAMLAVQ
jgi:hypothetical protein